ncbi:MAG: hypothetical protein GXY83_12025 [Rhodopirellula sp.]|nr:hypothetical protein [Rhodopirellula sp.]
MSHTSEALPSGRSHHGRRRRRHEHAAPDPLLRIVDGGLAACIFLLPLIMGGRQALGVLTLSILALGIGLAWVVRQYTRGAAVWRRCSLEWVFLAAIAVLLLQMVPLPEPILQHLAPHTGEILPLWSPQADAGVRLGTWNCVSLAPTETRAGLMTLVAYCIVFLVTVQRIARVEDVERLLRWCAVSVSLMAAFAIVQLLTSNGKFFWFYRHPYVAPGRIATGSFVSRNHFADFLALGVGPVIWWIQSAIGKQTRLRAGTFRASGDTSLKDLAAAVAVIALGVVLFAGLLSLSRGGIAAMLVAALVAAAVCVRASTLGARFLLGLAAVALLVGTSLAIFGSERVSRRFADVDTCSFEVVDHGAARRTIWAAVVKAVPDFAVLGAGVGSFRDVYPRYLDEPRGPNYYTHAENSPLQVLFETGFAGLSLLLVIVGTLGYWCFNGLRRAPDSRTLVCVGAVTAGLTASLLHSSVDFNWYCPACTVLVGVLAASACRLSQISNGRDSESAVAVPLPRFAFAAAGLALVICGGWMLNYRIGPVVGEQHWARVRLMELTPGETENSLAEEFETAEGEPSQAQPPDSEPFDERMMAELQEVIRWDSDFARAHLGLARIYLRQFERLQQHCQNAMPLAQIREAVFAARNAGESPFTTREALDTWMSRAFGEHCRYLDLALAHTHQALKLAPTLGECYLYLSDLCFLEGGGPATKAAYIEQALALQPHDATVLFYTGKEAVLAGEFEKGLEYLRRSFHAGSGHKQQIIDWLAGRAPPESRQEEIRFLLEYFQPDFEGMRLLESRYAQIAQPEELAILYRSFAPVAQAEAERIESKNSTWAALVWLKAQNLYANLNEIPRALECGERAFRAAPNGYQVRYRLGVFLAAHEQYAEAERHFQWCCSRSPEDPVLQRKLTEVVKHRIDRQASAASNAAPGEYLQ